MGPMGFP